MFSSFFIFEFPQFRPSIIEQIKQFWERALTLTSTMNSWDREHDLLSQKHVGKTQWIDRLLFQEGMFLKGQIFGCRTQRAAGPSAHKLNETLDCIFNQHWFPGSAYDHNSMFRPWLNISSMSDKVVEVISWLPLVPLGVQRWHFKYTLKLSHFEKRLS